MKCNTCSEKLEAINGDGDNFFCKTCKTHQYHYELSQYYRYQLDMFKEQE